MPGFSDFFRLMLKEKRPEWHNIPAPELKEKPPLRAEEGHLLITHINHNTFLIQVEGLNIITDPIWSERAGPGKRLGPKRKRAPGIKLEDLPPIDLILLSHNHYDHMDISTITQLTQDHPAKILVPIGNSHYLEKNGIRGAKELDWWDSYQMTKLINITCLPARHFSGRGPFDRNKALWCGFMITNDEGNIYYSGDTAYGSFVEDISKKFQPIILSILPIGAFKPEWFMRFVHTSPDEAVKMHLDLGSQKSIAAHFGTFPLAWEGMDEPANRLREVLAQNNLINGEFIVPEAGKVYIIK